MADADPPPSTYVSQLACNHLDWTTVTELPVPIAACEECLKIAEANVGDALPGFHDYFS